jgi:hypothetical protein
MSIAVYATDGGYLASYKFNGTPLVGDVLLVNDTLVCIESRRWTQDGDLEVVVAVLE